MKIILKLQRKLSREQNLNLQYTQYVINKILKLFSFRTVFFFFSYCGLLTSWFLVELLNYDVDPKVYIQHLR